MKKIYILIIILTTSLYGWSEPVTAAKISLQGTITDIKNQPIIGASIYFPELKTGAVTDVNGKYKLDNLPGRAVLIQVSSVGYKMITETLDLTKIQKKDFILTESVTEISEVAVTGQAATTRLERTPSPISVVTVKDLEQHNSTNIIDALSSQPGISQITTGSGISKPVIRGLGYNRVVVMNDGVRQEGQQWGDEHGVEIDEFDVNRVEILKGPASLMYGSDAMAGVISFFSAPVLPQGSMQLNVLANYQTNNGLMAYSADFAGHKKTFIWDLRYSNKNAHAYHNQYDGYVYNSGFSENALSALVGISNWWGYSHLTLSTYHLTPGIVKGERDSLTGQFVKTISTDGINLEDQIATKSDFLSYNHQIPYQQVKHYKAVWNNNVLIGDGSLKAIVAFQQNQRQEFADALTPNAYGLYFLLHTLSYDFNYKLPEFKGFDFSFGVNGMYQNSQNKGTEFLVPEYRLFDAGVFVVGKKTIGNLDISGGLRFDQRYETADALYLNNSGEKTTSADPLATERFKSFNRNFKGISGSLGVSYQMNKFWNTKLNLSRGFRSPNISELSSNGVHEGTVRYETGNSDLKSETSLQLDYELGFNTDHISSKLNLFANNISNYIYSHKLNNVLGNDSLQSGLPVYKFDSGNVQMLGGEFYIDIHPHPWDWLHFENSLSYVFSELKNQPDSTRYLPFTPAPKWISDLKFDIKDPVKHLKNTYFSVGIEHYFKQDKIYSAYNTETATDAYTLINAGFGTDVMLNKQKLFSLMINGSNLADIAYQSHLSRLKYGPVNNVTGREGVFNMGRNISIKVIVPVNL